MESMVGHHRKASVGGVATRVGKMVGCGDRRVVETRVLEDVPRVVRSRKAMIRILYFAALIVLVMSPGDRCFGDLPAMPVPPGNPITEPKRILGKILFWDEQLSSNNTVACGTCHILSSSGSDPRLARHAGPDSLLITPDDIFGSHGIARTNNASEPVYDATYGWNPQITGRSAPSMIGSQYAPELFWDGRASSTFLNPETGEISLASGGALESQAVGPIMSDVEMAHESRDWESLVAKLEVAIPLDLATDYPLDVAASLSGGETYPELFALAFGDSEITAERIAFAIATYERTLFPDQTPWDAYVGGDASALSADQIVGWNFFQSSPCHACHTPPLFTDHSYRNVGLRPPIEDGGRQDVTELFEDRGKFRVPSLRNVGLKKKFMHTGRILSVENVVGFYTGDYSEQFSENRDPLIPGIDVPLPFLNPLLDFLSNGLTDPRVETESFPFDRPTLRSERVADFGAFTDCMSNPGNAPTPKAGRTVDECLDLCDVDGDGDVDLGDHRRLLWTFSAQ